MIMFPQVNRQYLCLPNLNTLNVLLGTLNQVWWRITVSSLLHKQVLFSLFNAFTVNRSFYLQDWIFQTSRMATGGYEAATSMIHRRRAPVKRGENRIGSKHLVLLFVLYKRFVSTQQRVNFWPVENSWLFLVWFKLHFPALKPLFVLMIGAWPFLGNERAWEIKVLAWVRYFCMDIGIHSRLHNRWFKGEPPLVGIWGVG